MWLNFNPQAGHEQAGRQPALALSPRSYNDRAGLALFCPVTTALKGYPFEVALPREGDISGVVLSDHIKSLDWRTRQAGLATQPTTRVVEQVLEMIDTLLRCRRLRPSKEDDRFRNSKPVPSILASVTFS